MRANDVLLTVKDFAIDKVKAHEIQYLQRYFLREYCCWLSMQTIAEMTGGRDHSRVIEAVRIVKSSQHLYSISVSLKEIFTAKMKNRTVNLRSTRFWYPKRRAA